MPRHIALPQGDSHTIIAQVFQPFVSQRVTHARQEHPENRAKAWGKKVLKRRIAVVKRLTRTRIIRASARGGGGRRAVIC